MGFFAQIFPKKQVLEPELPEVIIMPAPPEPKPELPAIRHLCFSKRSLENLEGVHPDLVKVCEKALEMCCEIDGLDFIITDGCRTLAEQVQFVAQGKSRTMHSRHLDGFAIDYVALVAGRVTYDLVPMERLSMVFKQAAAYVGVPIHWGGDWTSFKDTPHIELDRERYPDVRFV